MEDYNNLLFGWDTSADTSKPASTNSGSWLSDLFGGIKDIAPAVTGVINSTRKPATKPTPAQALGLTNNSGKTNWQMIAIIGFGVLLVGLLAFKFLRGNK